MPVWEIAGIHLRHNACLSLAAASAILMLTPVLFGTANLDRSTAAVPLEMFVSFMGIVLLTPVFQPEQSEEIADVVFAKYVSADTVYLIRTVCSLVFLTALTGLFGAFMRLQKSDVTLLLVAGTVANEVFLGSLGMLTAVLTGNTVIAYMIPLVYYMLNYGSGSRLGHYYLFSMRALAFTPKIWLLTTGILLIAASLLINRGKRKRK